MTPLKMSRYPVNWRKVARELKAAAGNRCQECDTPSADRMLTCAHVFPPSHAPDAEVVQVAILCLTCHLRYDAAHAAARMRHWHRRHNMTLMRMRSPEASRADIADLEQHWPGYAYLERLEDGVDHWQAQYPVVGG